MRNEMQEPGRGALAAATRTTMAGAARLQPSAVDAALGDETAPVVPVRGSRRDMTGMAVGADAAWMTIDNAHRTGSSAVGAASDGSLLRQLSRQLNLLEIQQQQIRALLEQTERRATSGGTSRIDR